MAAPRFCSECGEQIKVNYTASLPFRSFCARCSPRFKQARLMLIAAAALCVAVGFAIGHYSTAREPFYYIGIPVESSASHVAHSPDNKAAQSSRASEAGMQREQLAIVPSAAEGICGARTKSGKPCQRKVKGGGYCWQHRDRLAGKKSSPTQ